MRSLHDPNGAVTNPIPGLNMGKEGSATSWMLNYVRWRIFVTYCNRCIEEYATNDLAGGASPATPLATIESNLSAIWTILRAQGVQKIIRTKLLDWTTSTDNWETEANQTQAAQWQSGSGVDTINNWLSSQVGVSPGPDYFVPMVSMRGVNPYNWIVNGTLDYATADGIHPAPAFHEALAGEVRTAIAAVG
jgi:hypothetical protein